MSIIRNLARNWKRPDNYVVLVIIVFFLGWMIGPRFHLEIAAGLLPMSVMPLVTVFAGAWAAFKLQESHEERKERVNEKDAINRTIIKLIRQWIAVNGYIESFREYADDPARFINIPAFHTKEVENVTLDLDSIAFLTDWGYSDFVISLMDEQMRYDQVIENIAVHCQAVNGELRPALQRSGIAYTVVSMEDIRKNLGDLLVNKMKILTDNIYECTWRSHETLESAIDQLHDIGATLYPNHTIIKLDKSKIAPE